ncbi:MAG: TQO small subunit DoxD, partial [Solirubrobacteraceae bacterium]
MRVRSVSPALALLPLRLFLGVTFMYAGIQKLSDPGFLHPGAPTYIGTLLHDYSLGTPGGFILRSLALPDPALAGVGVALVEIAVGLLVAIGLVTRGAALVGLLLNLLLFLTASWKTSPYFMGSDIVFVFAWLPLVLAGTDGQPALEHLIAKRADAAV